MKRTYLSLIFILFFMNNMNAQNPDFLFMVEQAIKAPSGHNTQPWLFKVNDQSIEIHPNLSKSLSVVDPDNRELFVSLGCATENLRIAASQKGYDSKVSISNEGIITIELTRKMQVTPNSLFRQIALRQTNRSIYNGVLIADDSIETLKTVPLEPGIRVHCFKWGTPEYDTIAAYVYRGNGVQMNDTNFKNELREWMRYNKRHMNATNDGLAYAVFGAPNLPKFIVKPIMANAINEGAQNKGDRRRIESASHLMLFTSQNNTVREWINLGMTLERFLLKATEMNIAHSYFNQPNEIRELSLQMAESLHIKNQSPTILIRLGYAKPMPYSKRKKLSEVLIK